MPLYQTKHCVSESTNVGPLILSLAIISAALPAQLLAEKRYAGRRAHCGSKSRIVGSNF